MANLFEYEKLTVKERQNRRFSEEFRRKKVNEIERCVTSVSEASREYQVSRPAIYAWMRQYSRMRKKQERVVVESLSDTRKIAGLKEKIKELERAVGQKQIQIDFFDKMIELAEAEYGIDIKKKMYTAALRWFWSRRAEHGYKMNQVYRATGISKQGFHQHLERHLAMLEEQEHLVPIVAEIRRDHPQMSARVMCRMIKPRQMGRDRFEQFCFSRGFKIERKAHITARPIHAESPGLITCWPILS